MGNNKSSLNSVFTDKIEKIRNIHRLYDTVDSTIQRELKESKSALKFYEKTFNEQQKLVEHFRKSEEDLRRKITSITSQMNNKITSLRETRNPDNDKLISGLKLVYAQLIAIDKMNGQGSTIEELKVHADSHISMMKELKQKFLDMTARQQKNALVIQDAWKQVLRRKVKEDSTKLLRADQEEKRMADEGEYEKQLRSLTLKKIDDSDSDSDSDSGSDSVSSVSSVGSDIRDLQLHGGRKKLLRRRRRYKSY